MRGTENGMTWIQKKTPTGWIVDFGYQVSSTSSILPSSLIPSTNGRQIRGKSVA